MSEPTNKEIFDFLLQIQEKWEEQHTEAVTALRCFQGEVRERLDISDERNSEHFKEVKASIRELSETAIPLSEQTEILARLRRIEDHLNLPHELETS